MIIRESEKLPNVGLPGTDMEGKHLMQHPFDDMEFGAYYVILEAGKELTLKGPTHKTPVEEIKYSHGYYCLEGRNHFNVHNLKILLTFSCNEG